MRICRFFLPGVGPRLGLAHDESVYDLTATGVEPLHSFGALLALSCSQGLATFLAEQAPPDLPTYAWAELDRPPSPSVPHLLAPVDVQEIWAAGVTYRPSREARKRESIAGEFYQRIYTAERPEIFLKATPSRLVGPNDLIGLRSDSTWTVPEPELALILNSQLHLIGYSIGNDMTARDIEGENPLYIPQAKIFARCCSLGPTIVLTESFPNVRHADVTCTIYRQGQSVFCESTSIGRMKRDFAELITFLGRDNIFPNGVVLLTGTGMVPPDDFSLQDGDVVEIAIAPIGVLRNKVKQLTGS